MPRRSSTGRRTVFVPVTYERIGLYCHDFDLKLKPGTETINYSVVRKNGAWEISGPHPEDYPYVSETRLCESLTKTADDRNLGRPVFVSGPFQDDPATATSKCASYASSPSTTEGTESVYDSLGRITGTTARAYDTGSSTWVNRTTSTTYTGNSIQVADAGNGTRSISKINKYDGLGRLAAVCEVSGDTQLGNSTSPDCGSSGFDISGTGFKTTYSYDTLDRLLSATQGSLNGRSYSYDALGHLLSVSTPESGLTEFHYTTEGLMDWRKRPQQNQTATDDAHKLQTSYTYDGLHRLTQVSYTNDPQSTPTVNYTYDLASDAGVSFTNYVGRLGRATVGQTKNWFSYDELGRVTSNWQMVPPQYATSSFQLQYTYDNAGDVLTFNNAFYTMTYTYDVLQRLNTATSSWSNTHHPATMFSSPSYGRFGIGTFTAGYSINGGIQTVLGYNNFGETTSKSATDSGGGGTTRFSMGSMSYAPNGMLTGATVNSSAWTHAYDDMGRILTSQNGSSTPWDFKYDRYGNRWEQSQSGVGTSTPADNTSNRLASSNPQGISYDALGNIVAETVGVTAHTYKFDAENRMIQVDSGSTATYVYDAFNRRVQKTAGGTTYNYTYDLGNNVVNVYTGTSTLTWARGEVFLGSAHLATYGASATYFHHQNWLGSRATTTDDQGNKVQDCEWYPFGDLKTCTTSTNLYAYTPYGYADYERDSETGLDHMQFRYYNSRIGRFMGADLLGGDTQQPESLNQFGYVQNTPVNATDPLGLDISWNAGQCGPEYASCTDAYGNQLYQVNGVTVSALLAERMIRNGSAYICQTCGPTGNAVWINNLDIKYTYAGTVYVDKRPGYWTLALAGQYKAAVFFADWVFGSGASDRYYGPNSVETRDMARSYGAELMRQQNKEQGCPGSGTFTRGTLDAYGELLSNPGNATQAQVGGYQAQFTNYNGMATYTIYNYASFDSFFGHIFSFTNRGANAIRNALGVPKTNNITALGHKQIGSMRDIYQVFSWREPSPCQ